MKISGFKIDLLILKHIMQLNLTDGTCTPIKRLSEVKYDSSAVLSDKDLTALILTLKGCADYLQLNRQLHLRSLMVSYNYMFNHLDEYELLDDDIYLTVLKIPVIPHAKFICSPKITTNMKLSGAASIKATSVTPWMPTVFESIVVGNSIEIKSDFWMMAKELEVRLVTEGPMSLPIELVCEYKIASLPIGIPEKNEIDITNNIWTLTRRNNGCRWKAEIVELD